MYPCLSGYYLTRQNDFFYHVLNNMLIIDSILTFIYWYIMLSVYTVLAMFLFWIFQATGPTGLLIVLCFFYLLYRMVKMVARKIILACQEQSGSDRDVLKAGSQYSNATVYLDDDEAYTDSLDEDACVVNHHSLHIDCDSCNDDMENTINPANGLPMMGAVDIEGNPYGTDFSHDDSFTDNCMNDTFSSTDSMGCGTDDMFNSTGSMDCGTDGMFDSTCSFTDGINEW